jgi:predicted nucleotidyltransferase
MIEVITVYLPDCYLLLGVVPAYLAVLKGRKTDGTMRVSVSIRTCLSEPCGGGAAMQRCGSEGSVRQYPLMFVDDAYRQSEAFARRYAEAWEVARHAAAVLKSQFGARRVVVFGSLADRSRFTRWSDIDLAAWDIPGPLYWSAVDAVTGLSSTFRVDLVDPRDCSPALRQAMESEGVEL